MRILLKILITAIALNLLIINASAKDNDPYKGYDETLYMDMEFEDNLKSPVVDQNAHQAVKTYMGKLARDLVKKNYTVDLMRNDEVVLVTIPSDEIFLPNDTLLSPEAPGRLTPIVALFSDPMMMKMVYAVHTDNTGSPYYNMWLSHERNNSVYDWLLDNINEDLIVIPYEMGDTDPISNNSTRKGRKENRRLEIFFIPGPKMITLARKGQLK